MRDIADDRNAQFVEIGFVATNGEHIKHRLRGMGVTPVSAVNHANVRGDVFGDEMRGAAVRVAYDEHIAVHRFEGA